MKIHIEKIKSITVAVMMVLLLGLITSCQKDSLPGDTGVQDSDECTINISVSDSEEQIITSRSAPILQEEYVEDLYLLCFDESGEFKKGEVKEIKQKISSSMSLTTKIVTGTQGTVVALANSAKFSGNVADKTKELNDAMSGKTIDSLNVVFMNSWNNFKLIGSESLLTGKFMPMSSTQKYISRPKDISIQLIHSFAKLQVSYNIKPGDDITGLFAEKHLDHHQFYISNYLKKGFNNIYRDSLPSISITSREEKDFEAWSSSSSFAWIKENSLVTPYLTIIYLPEYPNSVLAKGSSVDSLKWHKDRMCILIYASDGGRKTQWFRLDFCQKEEDRPYKFLDIERNKHITFTVTAVKGNGYATAEEALAAPSSNIEFTVDVSEKNQVVNSNGQYAICMTNDATIIKGGTGTYNVATVSYQVPEGIDLSSLEANSSVTTNMPSSITNAKLLFNGIQITQGMRTPPKILSGSNIIQLVTEDNTGEVDCQVYLAFGNIRNTVVVKRYPYNERKLELNMSAFNVPFSIWEKNDAKMAVSATKLSVPYRIQPSDGYTLGTIAGKFKIGTASAGPAADAPFSTHVKVEVLQKGIDNPIVNLYTTPHGRKILVNNVPQVVSSIGRQEILIPDSKLLASAYEHTDEAGYTYRAAGWKKGMTYITQTTESGTLPYVKKNNTQYDLNIPYSVDNMEDYTAVYEGPFCKLEFDLNNPPFSGAEPDFLRIPEPKFGFVDHEVNLPAPVVVTATGWSTKVLPVLLYWTDNPGGTGTRYYPSSIDETSKISKYNFRKANQVLYAKWETVTARRVLMRNNYPGDKNNGTDQEGGGYVIVPHGGTWPIPSGDSEITWGGVSYTLVGYTAVRNTGPAYSFGSYYPEPITKESIFYALWKRK